MEGFPEETLGCNLLKISRIPDQYKISDYLAN
jgi:hypothetical protein